MTGIKGARRIALLALLIILIPSAMAFVITPELPSTAHEGDLVRVVLHAPDNAVTAIYLDGQNVSQTGAFNWQTDYGSAGTHTFMFKASLNNETVSTTRTLQVLDVPLSVVINSPVGRIGTNEVFINITTSIPVDICTFTIDADTGLMNGAQTTWFASRYLETVGLHILTIACSSEYDKVSITREFTIDTAPPLITSSGSNGNFNSDRVQLTVTTDEIAMCKYGNTDTSYQSMPVLFEETGDLAHTSMVRQLTQGTHTKYVRCKDTLGNVMQSSANISFSVNLPPSVTIEIDQTPPLRAGTYSITVHPSERILDPQLSYTYQDTQTKVPIALVGDDLLWEGYLQVEENAGERIGVFSFSAKDETGLQGTGITSGKIFLVDTKPPSQVTAFKAVQVKNAIELKWEYDNNDRDYFKVYSSDNSGITKSIDGVPIKLTSYLDTNLEPGQKRYYRVSVVDGAGNEGELSPELSVTFKDYISGATSGSIESKQTILSPESDMAINDTLAQIERQELQAKGILDDLQGLGSDAQEMMVLMSTLAEARARYNDVLHAKQQVQGTRNQDIDSADLLKTLKKLASQAQTALSEMPRSLKVEDKAEFEQTLDIADIDSALQEYLLGKEIDTKAYRSDVLKAQDSSKVIGRAYHVRIQYEQGSREYTVVTKNVLAENFTGEVLETIPKSFARKAADITFVQKPTILNPDPVVSWEYSQLPEHKITYYVTGFIDIEEARAARTILMPAVQQEEQPSVITGAVTGNAGGNHTFDYLLILGAIIVLGLGGYYFFAFRAEEKSEEDRVGEPMQILQVKSDIPLLHDYHALVEEGNKAVD
ncbi:MAG: fibronectin type III domain-containing protein, partial [Candidatus Woesearchaeota archaeon]